MTREGTPISALSSSDDLSEWPTKLEAAQALDLSVRTIERLISGGKIEARKRRHVNGERETVCHPRDVERLQPEAHVMPAESAALVRAESALALERKAAPSPLDIVAAALATMAAGERGTAAESHKRWLTVAEASDSYGLSKALLRREIRSGSLQAVKDGAWKISREALDNWQPKP